MKYFNKVKKYVDSSYLGCATGGSVAHFESIVEWLKKLKPDADETMLIAAYAHDIQRAFRKTNTEETFKEKEFNNPEIMRYHQDEGARIISEFLRGIDYPPEEIERVKNMVSHHEEGGDAESDLIKDADSLSYFSTNAIKHAKKTSPIVGKDKIRNKINWMYDRISSAEAKKLAEPMYKEVIGVLEAT